MDIEAERMLVPQKPIPEPTRTEGSGYHTSRLAIGTIESKSHAKARRRKEDMDYLDLTLPTAEENLALDEALLLDAEENGGSEVLRFWELPNYAVVMGSSCCLQAEVREAACQADGVPVLRRCSGGGSVLLGPGCLVFSLVMSFERAALRDVTRSYAYILERIRMQLARQAPMLAKAGSSDLCLGDLKISGNSQRRLRSYLLHHGTILYDFDLARISRYLHLPSRQPAYRHGRDHAEFVTNLSLSPDWIKEKLRDAWSVDSARAHWPRDKVEQLVVEKYRSPEWTRRR